MFPVYVAIWFIIYRPTHKTNQQYALAAKTCSITIQVDTINTIDTIN